MASKELKKEYDKTRITCKVSFNAKEFSMLEIGMKEGGWENMAGYVKSKIFPDGAGSEFKKTIRKLNEKPLKESEKDYAIILKNIMGELVREVGYINYRFSYEMRAFENSSSVEGKEFLKRLNKLETIKNSVLDRTGEITSTLQSLLRMMHIKVEREREDSVRYVPTEELEKKVRSDWNDINSPEIHELARRYNREGRRRMGIVEKEQD